MTEQSTDEASAWRAPTAQHGIDAVVQVPGSKSATNRALVLAALAHGPGSIESALDARDTRLMAAALEALGTRIRVTDAAQPGNLDMHVVPGALRGPASIDVGLAGTVMRFVPPVAALATGRVTFDGDPHARARPMGTTISALRSLGVHIEPLGAPDALPFAIDGTGSVRGGSLEIDASASSQFVSALLLAAPCFDHGLELRHVGPPVPSQPHIDMTIAMLRERGVEVEATRDHWIVSPGPIAAVHTVVEPDLSNAAPFLAAAMVTHGRVRIPGWPRATTQPGDALRELLTRMGATIILDDDGLVLTQRGPIHGIDADLRDVGELAPTIAAIAALADSPTTLRGIAHLRGHETDRLAALATELSKIGCRAAQTDDGLVIEPGPLRAAHFATYADHRMATAGAIIGLAVEGIDVENIATTAKTIPDFPARWDRMLATS